MKLDIILRTCQRSQFETNKQNVRICGDNRDEMVYKCLASLVNAINRAPYDIKFTILDDNSDESFVQDLHKIISHCNKHTEIVQLENNGPNNSAYEQFYRASQCEDLVYSVEDDYLHEPDAILYMINAYYHFVNKYQDVAIFPFDCPFRYIDGIEDTTILYHDGIRYWRNVRFTSNTFLTSSAIVRNNFDTYSNLALNYPNVTEDDTINKLYVNMNDGSGFVNVFSPIPSCAYHLSYQEPVTIQTVTNWKQLWKLIDYSDLLK